MRISHDNWRGAARNRYGDDAGKWKFRCPACGHVAAAEEWAQAGGKDMIAFSCIGRLKPNPRSAFGGTGPGPCNYAGGGLFAINPVTVVFHDGKEHHVFDFADSPLVPPAPAAAAKPGSKKPRKGKSHADK